MTERIQSKFNFKIVAPFRLNYSTAEGEAKRLDRWGRMEKFLDELRLLRFLPGVVLGLAIGINANRFIWPQAVRLVPGRIIRAIYSLQEVFLCPKS